jgi:hypothetical protein
VLAAAEDIEFKAADNLLSGLHVVCELLCRLKAQHVHARKQHLLLQELHA